MTPKEPTWYVARPLHCNGEDLGTDTKPMAEAIARMRFGTFFTFFVDIGALVSEDPSHAKPKPATPPAELPAPVPASK